MHEEIFSEGMRPV